MSLKKLILFILTFSLFTSEIYSQDFFLKKILNDIGITASINYVSSASILLNPNSSDIIEKNSTVDFAKGGYGYGFSLKKKIFGDDFSIGISTEYIKITDDQLATTLENNIDFIRVRVSETVEMIPVEASLYFNIPKFVDNLNVFIGGGAGFYFGDRKRTMVKMETQTLSKTPLFSLNVLFGLEYMMDNHFAVNLEMKVRDGKYKVRSSFPTDHVTLNEQTYYFTKEFESKVYVDGLKMSLGIAYYF